MEGGVTMRRLESSTLSNQNLYAASPLGLLVHTYTADVDRAIFFRVFLDQIAGNGDYVAYLTIQRLGAGSAYRVVPITTATVASGVTAAMLVSGVVAVKNTDVVKVYVLGLSGDTTTPDTITEVWDDCLPSAAPGAANGVPVLSNDGLLISQASLSDHDSALFGVDITGNGAYVGVNSPNGYWWQSGIERDEVGGHFYPRFAGMIDTSAYALVYNGTTARWELADGTLGWSSPTLEGTYTPIAGGSSTGNPVVAIHEPLALKRAILTDPTYKIPTTIDGVVADYESVAEAILANPSHKIPTGAAGVTVDPAVLTTYGVAKTSDVPTASSIGAASLAAFNASTNTFLVVSGI
jgi:hypothetical protein